MKLAVAANAQESACDGIADEVSVAERKRATMRAALLERQRGFAVPPGLVADGRDMGTVVFPQAQIKIFLYASPDERAQRRYKQLKQKGVAANLAALSREIAERDQRDSTRAISPLVASDDAVSLDTTGMTVDDVIGRVLQIAQGRIARV